MNYLEIMDGQFFKDTYAQIEKLKENFPVNHGFVHINNVLFYAKQLASLFKLTKEQTELLLVACTLHDIGYLKGRDNHADNGSVLAQEFLIGKDFTTTEINIICNAIKNHGGKSLEAFTEPVSMCLAFADKLDFAENRYKKDISLYPKIAPYFNILYNTVAIENGKLILNVHVNNNFSLESLEDDYFNIKLKNVLSFVSQSQNLTYELNYVVI